MQVSNSTAFSFMNWLKSCWRNNFRELISLGVVLTVYIISLTLSPNNVFWSPDEGVRFLMANSLTSGPEQGNNKGYAGIIRDPDFRFYPGYYKYSWFMYPIPQDDGTIKYPWAVGFPRVAGLFYRAYGITGIYVIPLLSAWLITLIIWRFSINLIPSLAFWAILLVGLGTPIFFYSQVFWDHSLATLLGMVALFTLATKPQLSINSIFLIVLPLVIAITLRVEMIAFALAIGLAWLVSLRRVPKGLKFPKLTNKKMPQLNPALSKVENPKRFIRNSLISIMFLLFLALILYFLLPVRYAGEFSRLGKDFLTQKDFLASAGGFLARNIKALPHLLINSSASEGLQLSAGLEWIGIVALLICIPISIIRARDIDSYLLISSLTVMFGLILIAIFSTQTYRSLHGFFICAPYALISAHGLKKAWQRRRYQELVVYISAVLYFLIGTAAVLVFRAGKEVKSWPGLEWGQRYLLTLYPLLAILSLLALRDYWKSQSSKILKVAVIGLTIILMTMSFSIQIRGIWMLRESKLTIRSWLNNLEIHTSDPVITDEWWLPASLATFFTTHEMYSFYDADDFSHWLSQIGSNDVDSFTYVSSSPINLTSISNLNLPIQRISKQYIGGLSFIRYSINQEDP